MTRWAARACASARYYFASWVSAVSAFPSLRFPDGTASMRLPLILALTVLGAAVAHSLGAAAPAPLTLSDALLTTKDGKALVTAPGWALRGTQRAVTPASSPLDCAAACAARPDCQWANFCPVEVRGRGGGQRKLTWSPLGTGPFLRSPAATPLFPCIHLSTPSAAPAGGLH